MMHGPGIKTKTESEKKKEKIGKKENSGADFFTSQDSRETEEKPNKSEKENEKNDPKLNKSMSFFIADHEGKE